MNKYLKRGIQGTLFVAIIGAFIYIGTRNFDVDTEIDNERFDHDYQNVSKDNVFVYASAQDVYAKLKNGTAIIFMGYPANKWSGYYANILNETAKKNNIKEILYYDFYEDRTGKNATYQSIVMRLSNYVPTLDNGTQNIYAPMLVVVKNGKIITVDNETAINIGKMEPTDYWDKARTSLKENSFKTAFDEYLKEE